MEKIKIAAPLFIVKEDAENDLFGVLEKMAEIGFDGVEFLGLFEKKPKEIAEKLSSLGLEALGDHVPLQELIDNAEKVLDDHKIIGCSYITIAWPARDIHPSHPLFEKTLEQVGAAAEKIKKAGLTPLYHNHDFEISEEAWISDLFSVCEEKGLQFEPDLGWIAFAGKEPEYYLKKYGHISPVIHLKDIYADDIEKVGVGDALSVLECDPEKGGFAFRPTGYGSVNFPKLMPLCIACHPEWFVADHDQAYMRNSYEDLKLSYQYICNLLQIIS